jgi:hypothetical protein
LVFNKAEKQKRYFLAKMALGIWDDEKEAEPEDDRDMMVPA